MNAKFELIPEECEIFDDENYYEEKVILTDHDERINKIIMTYNEYNDIMKKLDGVHYENNIYCSRYLGDHIERYVMEFLGGERIPIEMEDRRDGILRRPIDFLLNYNGKKLKIKHIASCIEYGSFGYHDAFYWRFNIDFNHRVDAFILSAWDTRKSLKPQYMWLIMKDQNFNKKPFWNRQVLFVEDTKNRITFMEEFEMKNIRLGKLQNYVLHAKKNDVIASLLDKRRDILIKIDIEVNLKRLMKRAMLLGLEKRLDE